MRISEMRYKEIINVCNGHRLGFVSDAEIDFPAGSLKALIVPGPAKFLGIFGREPDFLIPVECVTRMGQDIILVEIKGEYHRGKKGKKTYY